MRARAQGIPGIRLQWLKKGKQDGGLLQSLHARLSSTSRLRPSPGLPCAFLPVQRTQSWLERYIFKRAPRAYNMNLTYFISAFWHGFYPGYVMLYPPATITHDPRTVPLLQRPQQPTCHLRAGTRSIALLALSCPADGRYYLFFMSVPLLQNLSKAISTNIRPHTFVVCGRAHANVRLLDCLSCAPVS